MAHGTGTHVIGSSGDDYLLGTDGDDIVADNYRGLSTRPTGNDTLVGGMGNDYLTAPDSPNDESSDVFVFGPGHGDDTIVGDFEQEDGAQDVIDLSDFGAKAPTWDQLSAQIHRSGDDVAIDLRDFGGGVIRIRWVEPEDLTASESGEWAPEALPARVVPDPEAVPAPV